MIKVEYSSLKDIKRNYLKIFPTTDMTSKWKELQRQYPELKRFHFTIEHLLLGNFYTLARIYTIFTQKINNGIITNSLRREILDIFDYQKYQPNISAFFMNSKHGFKISTCHYCNISYINAYGMGLYYKSKLDFLNLGTDEELKKHITNSNRNIKIIKANRPYNNLAKFDNLKIWQPARWQRKKSDHIHLFSQNHFDLDHVLDKGKCPIISLSLMNFVPSCQICNQRLKHTSLLGHDIKSWCKLSPTSLLYNFDQNVKIRVIPISHISPISYMKNSDNFRIIFDCQDIDYQHFVNIFKLEDRYNYHKIEALRILDLRQRYRPKAILSISKILHRSYLKIYLVLSFQKHIIVVLIN